MKHCFLSYLMTVSLLLTFAPGAKAQDIPDDEGVIVIDITTNTTETGPKRSPALIPISASYRMAFSCIDIAFLYDIGDVTVSVINLATGFNSTLITDSSYGVTVLPLLRIPGLWEIAFSTEGGAVYTGSFIIP